MICFTAYIDKAKGKFSYENTDSYFIPMWMSVYLNTIILHLIHEFTIVHKSMKKELELTCRNNRSFLLNFFLFLSEQSDDNQVKLSLLLKRLELI